MANMYTLQDPTTRFPRPPFPPPQQDGPGDIHRMDPAADHGDDRRDRRLARALT